MAAINERIVYVNSHTTSGPPSDIAALDVERVVAEWRRRDAASAGDSGDGSGG